jgi:phosphatidylserine/phosphatidylglycerophosphate/cardiolipin synthase-like enzyme
MKKNELDLIIQNIKSERWVFPITSFNLNEVFDSESVKKWIFFLEDFKKLNFTTAQMICVLEKHKEEIRDGEQSLPELVWTGPEALNSTFRDTSIVVQDLFREAKNEVLIVGFAFYQGKEIFKELANKLDTIVDFRVVFIVDVRRDGNSSAEEAIILKFKTDFLKKQWPGKKMPEIYFDPRTLDLESDVKSSMHAKCIVVDSKKSFITSANFTQAAHQRNIEAGVVLDSVDYAINLKSQFMNLVESKFFREIE